MSFNCDRKKSNLLCNFSVQSHLKIKEKCVRISKQNISTIPGSVNQLKSPEYNHKAYSSNTMKVT